MDRKIKIPETKPVEKKDRDQAARYFYYFIEAWANEKEIPRDALDYVASRLIDVMEIVGTTSKQERNNPIVKALGLSGWRDADFHDYCMGLALAELEYKHRRKKKDAEKLAIREFCEKNPKYKQSTITKYYRAGIIWPAVSAITDYAADKDIPLFDKTRDLPNDYKQLIQYFTNKQRDMEK